CAFVPDVAHAWRHFRESAARRATTVRQACSTEGDFDGKSAQLTLSFTVVCVRTRKSSGSTACSPVALKREH
ncbi:unnamed protein product, partial [Pylaiella littoralis]